MSSKLFNARSTALEVIEGHDLSKYEIIVTGGSSGIGVETVRALAKAGARVVIGARDLVKAEEIAKQIREETKNPQVEVEKLELDSLASVRDFVKRYLDKKRPLNILINNAGVMACPLAYTVDGFESQFGTNHMGHFALTLGLISALEEGTKVLGKKSRVVNVSSLAHVRSNIDFDDINFKHGRVYDPFVSYGQSKTANMLFSVELSKLYSDRGIFSNSVMPGGIMTGLQKHVPREEQIKKGWINEKGEQNERFKTIEQGASTTIWAAVAHELDGRGGLYLEDCQISKLAPSPEAIFKDFFGYLEYALNKESASKLWEISLKWLENPPK
jgi:NAD(P)-dependent dehydrogenase (short-subunit alcohol dehydrogenase family)